MATKKIYLRRETALARRIRLKIKSGCCTWCRKRIAANKGRRLWCSQTCVDAFQQANWPQSIRKALEARDGAVCAACGTDTKEFKAMISRLRALRRDYDLCSLASWLGQRIKSNAKIWNPWKYAVCRCFFCVAIREAESLSRWEADHITPVVEGGGLCGPEGYRTLCVPCHRTETAKLAARRASERRKRK